MKNRFIYSLVFAFCFSISLFAKQERYTKHIVGQGETINSIAQKYKVTPFDIYKLNPDSQDGIKLNSTLLIPPARTGDVTYSQAKAVEEKAKTSIVTTPKKEEKNTPSSTAKTHLVQTKETFYGISKMYGVTVDALQNANTEILTNGLKVGQTLRIPPADGSVSVTVTTPKAEVKEVIKPVVKTEPKATTGLDGNIYHIVEPKETKYGISKKYGLTIEELEGLNPIIVNGLNIGMKLLIKGNPSTISNPVAVIEKPKVETPKVETPKAEIAKPKEVVKETSGSTKLYLQEYVVRPKETVSSIAKSFNMSETELLQLNPEMKKGVKLGMIIRVPSDKKEAPTIDSPKGEIPKKEQTDLSKSINKSVRKKLALLLPFNLSKIENDTVKTQLERLKTDKFLNMTLDFYSGALMAIDSAKVLGLNIDIKILDSQETKNNSNVDALVNENDLGNSDAIIGPFYQNNVEKLCQLLETNNTPVISPMSKDIEKSYKNLYQSMPTNTILRNAAFSFMREKGGNILAIVDSKKGSVTQYIKQYQPDVKIIGLNDNGGFVADSLNIHLVKDKINYVVLASERTGMVLASTNAMANAMKDYKVQMVILEQNETLDFEEIPLARLTKLQMMYPSLSRPNESEGANKFDVKYKKLNKVLPNQYAIRGFDITFDTILRLSQGSSFEETTASAATQQIESKFDYFIDDIGYKNKGVYMLYYDKDLTIKEAN